MPHAEFLSTLRYGFLIIDLTFCFNGYHFTVPQTTHQMMFCRFFGLKEFHLTQQLFKNLATFQKCQAKMHDVRIPNLVTDYSGRCYKHFTSVPFVLFNLQIFQAHLRDL